jgi:hypothetical protein
VTHPDLAPETLPAPSRPATVTVAFSFQLAAAGLLLLLVGATIARAVQYDGLIDQAARLGDPNGDAQFERSGNVFGSVLTGAPALLLALWLGLAAIWLRRGSNVARILTLVGFGAPALLGLLFCVCGGLAGVMVAGLFLEPSDEFYLEEEGGSFDSGFYDQLERLDSGGWSAAFGVTTAVAIGTAVLLGMAAVVLLLTRSANWYFRPRRPGPWAQYPPYPPPFPGYPGPMPCPYPPAHGWYATPESSGRGWYATPDSSARGWYGAPAAPAAGWYGAPAAPATGWYATPGPPTPPYVPWPAPPPAPSAPDPNPSTPSD